MNRKWLLGTLLSAGMIPVFAADYTNIILVNLDDVGYGDFSCNGAYGYKTPQIDLLAAQGVRFTHFLAAQPISGASRAGLLTGCYPNRIGFSGAPGPDADYGIHPDEMTLGEVLKQKGYSTAIFGKWHLGSQRAFLPLQNGLTNIMVCLTRMICGRFIRSRVRYSISQIFLLTTGMRW